jgi:hypothetical protein
VPRLAGDDGVEAPAGGLPVLEARDLDLGAAAPGEAGHPRVDLDAEHPAAERRELPRDDAGAAADVEHAGSGSRGGDRFDDAGGIARPAPVVALGIGAEGLRDVARLVGLLLCSRAHPSDYTPTLGLW